ncbi:hypothetical protein IPZ78_03905 [Sphingobacterium sp. WQ 366]|uniref:Substrate import-associated zinc metallohydrolase lipoprotein n=2 Tax=Sphingobacterium bovistauri TaxID=2781959 RepID=A0ABS7Z5Z7_9SPHI|nr:hypothetical protein [Sphingobacterium bovistauri]
MYIKLFLSMTMLAFLSQSCEKSEEITTIDESIDYFDIVDKPKDKWNELDYLCDSIYKAYGTKVIYEFTPKIIRNGNAFYYPATYDKSLAYTRLMVDKFWLKPLKDNFPEYHSKETPREYIIMGGYYHNTPVATNQGSGAGFNGQFYRLGMGGINNFDKQNKANLHDHLVILWHEHAHNQDVKYGRGPLFDNISVGTYYKEQWSTKTLAQANSDGFFRNYGGFAPEEDFATTVEHITRFPENTVTTLINTNDKLKTKYNFVMKFYQDKGLNLHRLQVLCDSVVYKTNY